MEPRSGRAGVHRAVFPELHGHGSHHRRDPIGRRRHGQRHGYPGCRFSTTLSESGPGLPAAIWRQRQRAVAPSARRRSADSAADGRRTGLARGSRPPGHPRQRRRTSAADLLDSGAAGKWPLHRRAALRTAAGLSIPADHKERLRAEPATQHDDRQAALRGHRLDCRLRARSRARIPHPQ
jgi:hypothetical protein